jgi:hypothetical protein
VGFKKKIERIDDRHFGDEIDLDAKFTGGFEEHQPRQIVRLRVLLPIDEMLLRLNPQRVTQNSRTAVRRRSQAKNLWAKVYLSVVAVVGDMVKGNVDGHDFQNASIEI